MVIALNVDTWVILMQEFADKNALVISGQKGEASMNFISICDIFFDHDHLVHFALVCGSTSNIFFMRIIHLGKPVGSTCPGLRLTTSFDLVY